jgi:hypothetical protein
LRAPFRERIGCESRSRDKRACLFQKPASIHFVWFPPILDCTQEPRWPARLEGVLPTASHRPVEQLSKIGC